jgi:alpha 1,3-glucosidase
VGLSFPRSDHLYGLHEHATGLVLRRTENDDPYRMYNLDHAEYPINDTASVYGAVPFIYGHGPEVTAGVFLHNAAQQFVDILPDQMAYFMAEAGTLDLFVFLGPTPAEILRQYLLITGVSYMPPVLTPHTKTSITFALVVVVSRVPPEPVQLSHPRRSQRRGGKFRQL